MEKIAENAFVICADGGIKHCEKLGINPDIFIADFDSSETQYPKNCEVITYPSEKDDTDFSLCVKKAIELGFNNIITFGALGGRVDHTIGAIQILAYCVQKGVRCTLSDYKNQVTMLSSGDKVPVKFKDNVSLFSYSRKCEGVTLKGMQYPLENATLTNSFPLGISNKVIEENATICIEKGLLLMVFSQD